MSPNKSTVADVETVTPSGQAYRHFTHGKKKWKMKSHDKSLSYMKKGWKIK